MSLSKNINKIMTLTLVNSCKATLISCVKYRVTREERLCACLPAKGTQSQAVGSPCDPRTPEAEARGPQAGSPAAQRDSTEEQLFKQIQKKKFQFHQMSPGTPKHTPFFSFLGVTTVVCGILLL